MRAFAFSRELAVLRRPAVRLRWPISKTRRLMLRVRSRMRGAVLWHPARRGVSVGRIVEVGLDGGRVDRQPVPPDDSSCTGELHQAREQRLPHGRVDELRETKERFGVGYALAPDPAELPVHEAPAHLALAFIETPSIEMLEHQHPEDDRGGRAQSAAAPTQRMAAGGRGQATPKPAPRLAR